MVFLGEQLKTGTTTVGIIGKDSIVLAADMRATMGHLSYDEESQKIYKITNYMAVTNAGDVGDSLTIIKFLKSQAKLYEIEREAKMSVKAAANLISSVLNANRYYPFMVQLLIGGINKQPELYEVTPDGGMLERKKYAVSGSGTEFALAVIDQGYKEGLAEEECIALAIKAVKAAKRRDIFSGGISITAMVIDSNGTRELDRNEIEKYLGKETRETGKPQKAAAAQ